jgi:hypothetical protein
MDSTLALGGLIPEVNNDDESGRYGLAHLSKFRT